MSAERKAPSLNQIPFEVFMFAYKYQDEHGYAPTNREIQSGLGNSWTGNIHKALEKLESAGVVERPKLPNGRNMSRIMNFKFRPCEIGLDFYTSVLDKPTPPQASEES